MELGGLVYVFFFGREELFSDMNQEKKNTDSEDQHKTNRFIRLSLTVEWQPMRE